MTESLSAAKLQNLRAPAMTTLLGGTLAERRADTNIIRVACGSYTYTNIISRYHQRPSTPDSR